MYFCIIFFLQAAVQGLLELKDVNFYYPTRPTVQVLKSYSITAQPGQMVALVGTSGCGKSTTVQLLERFYNPASGSVVRDWLNQLCLIF